MGKIWAPQPATKLYGANGAEPESIRDRFVKQYGAESVTRAEISCVLDVMMVSGMIKPPEFVDLLSRKLARIESMRRDASGFQG